MGFEAQQARPREALTVQQVEEDLRTAPAHVGVTLAISRAVAEIAPSVDHLLG
jgi:hypothetical protein